MMYGERGKHDKRLRHDRLSSFPGSCAPPQFIENFFTPNGPHYILPYVVPKVFETLIIV